MKYSSSFASQRDLSDESTPRVVQKMKIINFFICRNTFQGTLKIFTLRGKLVWRPRNSLPWLIRIIVYFWTVLLFNNPRIRH